MGSVAGVRPSGQQSWNSERFAPYLLLLPATAIVVALRVVPMVVALYLSFTDTDLSKPPSTPVSNVGFANYSTVLTSTDFWSAVYTTVVIVGPALVLEMLIGLGVALWLWRPIGLRGPLRGATLIPYLLVPVVIGNFFRMFFSAEFGQLNYYLSFFGVPPHSWLTDPGTVRWMVVAMETWHTVPFVALLCLAGLSGIPKDPIEAATVDGANSWQRFRYVVLPTLLPILGAVLALRAMDAIQLFDEVYVMTGGGPGRLTSVINLYLYQFGFRQFRIGQTAAAVTLLVGTIALACLIVVLIRRARERWREVSR